MNKPVRLDSAAERELVAAQAFYEERAGMGAEFIAAIREAARRVARRSHSFPLARGVSFNLGVRRCPVRRFPYALFFIERSDEILVIAVAHDRRRPGYWRRR